MTDTNMEFTTGDTISFDYNGEKDIDGTITGETKQFFKIQDYQDNDKTYRIKKNNKSFKFCYHINDNWEDSAGFSIKNGEYCINMCGGCAEWWNYVIRKDGIWIENKDGLRDVVGRLISCPEGNYLSIQKGKNVLKPSEDVYKLREGENDMFDMVKECYEDEIMNYEEESEEEKEENN